MVELGIAIEILLELVVLVRDAIGKLLVNLLINDCIESPSSACLDARYPQPKSGETGTLVEGRGRAASPSYKAEIDTPGSALAPVFLFFACTADRTEEAKRGDRFF